MTKSKFEIFLVISIILHLILIYYFKFSLNVNNIKNIKKNKEKSPIRVKFIELPDKLKEIKHNKKTPFIAQKSFLTKKNVKKENPLIKKKSVVVKDVIPKFLPSKPVKKVNKQKSLTKSKTKLNQISKIKKIKTTPKQKFKTKKKIKKKIINKRKIVKREIISLNKINPNFNELLKKGLIKSSKKTDNFTKKESNNGKNFKSNPELLAPGIFKPSHIYPDDIDISDSISISTQSSRFASYLHKVKRKIELVWEYPPLAGEMGIQGRLFVKFEIDKNGNLKMIKLLKSSGAKILDDEAIRALKEAAPYPPFPKDFKIKSIKIHACFDYIIVGKEIW